MTRSNLEFNKSEVRYSEVPQSEVTQRFKALGSKKRDVGVDSMDVEVEPCDIDRGSFWIVVGVHLELV